MNSQEDLERVACHLLLLEPCTCNEDQAAWEQCLAGATHAASRRCIGVQCASPYLVTQASSQVRCMLHDLALLANSDCNTALTCLADKADGLQTPTAAGSSAVQADRQACSDCGRQTFTHCRAACRCTKRC